MQADHQASLKPGAPGGRLHRLLKRLYHGLLSLPTGGRGIRRVTPGGDVFIIDPGFRYLAWSPPEYDIYRRATQPGAMVLDVGANAGQYTLLFGKWTGPKGRVHAFEPSPEAFVGLTRHVELNGLSDIVHCWPMAVSNRDGESDFLADGFQGTNRLVSSEHDRLRSPVRRVVCTTVDQFCTREGILPTFIKIDVEGAELQVLQGARETIRAAGKALVLFVELHPALWSGFGYDRNALIAELTHLGLKAVPIGSDDPWASNTGLPVRLQPQS